MAENPRVEELRRRVQADPASIAFAALAEEFRRIGRYEDAIETCRTGLQRHPVYLSARVTLGRALIEVGDYAAAREELDTVLRSAPENLAAIRGLAEIAERQGHSTELDPHLAALMNQPIVRLVPPPRPVAVFPQADEPAEPAAPPPLRHEAAPEPVPIFQEAAPDQYEPVADFPLDPDTIPATSPGIGDFALSLTDTGPSEPDGAPVDIFAAPLGGRAGDPAATLPAVPDFSLQLPPEPQPVLPEPMFAALGRLEHLLSAIQAARHA